MIVLDASVLLKWFLEEEDREKALVHWKRHIEGDETIAVPDLLFYEIANTLLLRTALSADEIQRSLDEVRSCDLHVAAFSEIPGVPQLARRHSLTAYDASYVALAQALRCRFVTADEKLLVRLKGTPRICHLREAVR